MRELSRVTGIAMLLIVALRLSIGWQFLYEGLWKIETLDSARPWSAEGYLKNAQGPMRDYYRGLTEDPDDFGWLDADTVIARWDAWYENFTGHYQLDENQLKLLDRKLDGLPFYVEPLEELPTSVQDRISSDPEKALSYDAEKKRLVVNSSLHLTPSDRDAFIRMAKLVEQDPTPEQVEQNAVVQRFHEAMDTLYKRQAQLSFKERVRAMLSGDPEIAGVTNEEFEGTIDERWPGEIDKYRLKLESYEKSLSSAQTEFQFEHAQQKWDEIQQLRSSLVNPVKAIDKELKDYAQTLLTAEQLNQTPPPSLPSKIDNINKMTIASLTILGSLLIVGLGTRLAALAGAATLLNFYMVIPPWPGVPQPPGPEHSLFINKNMIEIVALLAIAALPTGQWFGLDRLIRWCLGYCLRGASHSG